MSIFTRKRGYITPGGDLYRLYDIMAEQTHLLVAGSTGSGKSVVINGIIYNLLHTGPAENQLILIDPKRVELSIYRNIPHCLYYASEPADMITALQYALKITESRYKEMQRQGIRKYAGGRVYVIIDELADLMTTQKKAVLPLLQRLCQIGRAAKITVIACTQSPIAKIIPTEIGVNFDSRVALHTRNAQDSRNIIGISGAEQLPKYGNCYLYTPAGITLYNVPLYTDNQIETIVSYWSSRKCIA